GRAGAARRHTVPARPLRLALAGDVHGEPPVAGVLARGRSPLAAVSGVLGRADLAVVNLETAVGARGPAQPKEYTFSAPPALLAALADAGVDVVNLANNHALDYGARGLRATVRAARAAGLQVVGAGPDATRAYAPALVRRGGRTVAVVGLTRVLPWPEWAAAADRSGLASAYDVGAALAAVRRAARRAHTVVVAVHWGDELAPCPDDVQLDLAERLVRAGADVVAGHHPHVLQGVDRLGGALVAYSLGNFVWYADGGETAASAVLTATVARGRVMGHTVTPARIDPATGAPHPVAGRAALPSLRALAQRSPGVGCPGAS
ncbi:MAG: CapA family protein, partial [Actinobacteria bacterium]|nr:CapA family protein [Actinomycetota bacterium]